MKTHCRDLEDALRDGTLHENAALVRHARECAECGERVRAWNELSAAARSLRRSWDSPDLWVRIERDLREESGEAGRAPAGHSWRNRMLANRWLAAAACAAVLIFSAALGVVLLRHDLSPSSRVQKPDPEFDKKILTEQALRETEAAEAKYIESIEKLSKLADPLLQKEASPILLNYRERLLLLDDAIADCRANIQMNRSNAHLRRELVSIYQEKQRTLLDLMKEKTNDQQ